ncbi:sensor histidine kinase ResE [Clostridium pasteurianum DSM 525 = ATCC 6013]|uniref:histidine kinase n=1 Tax=Clostridium pasteurianum DSM 525 = ATCC 6013 TaxID=1262449 RepID=A0A0H3J810_CLOPA|nr:HAMP domain-containing sensor histidine kinase [Clostridium pasteurianum]AJA47140.1 sensor histidine kinase ResE [Clostridium pasteurianum DSM 525 = ATCC 6013]AJA51128.1 sensor histidine kinase ResE [Clostridium pasteurianum DSM 525 = ATCC 6013]AOZ74501.1 histidine kinase [Clostridium pasteurianum DSM 525 = ATCC 6013]AOZ78298.1 histidine kinase [Clostridium pasteurianum]ELP59471.1 two-component sensor histidine kinase [Clostridium pasteurianum DSM 525 = ATCC 6013]
MLNVLIIFCILLSTIVIILFFHIRNTKSQIKNISKILDDILKGNLDRRLFANQNDIISDICYKINEIVIESKNQLIQQNKSEKSYKELVTSLSHDIRTPLASLVGYLDAIDNNLVTGKEKDSYIQTAKNKAFSLNEYIQTLFEWLKLESGEWIYTFDKVDICEKTRTLIAEWISPFEQAQINYHVDIPAHSIIVNLDIAAYERIIDNLIANVINHSQATDINISILQIDDIVEINLMDNGIGISEKDRPYIFTRLYKCDSSRGIRGNGLGLAIVQELINAHKGTIILNSKINKETIFTIHLPRI